MNEATISGPKTTSGKGAKGKDKFSETFRPKVDNVDPAKVNAKKGENPKKTKKIRKLLIILISFIILVGGAVAALHFTGLLTPILEYVGLVEKIPEEDALEVKERALNKKEAALDEREKLLNERETQLNQLQAELEEKQKSLEEGNKTFEEILSELSEEKLEEIKKVANIYGNMDPAKAAEILENMYGNVEMSLILYHMKPAASALVLEQMNASLAAALTKIMLG
ncbi:MAG: MotE family protein [Oscillospiraceae bacterium]